MVQVVLSLNDHCPIVRGCLFFVDKSTVHVLSSNVQFNNARKDCGRKKGGSVCVRGLLWLSLIKEISLFGKWTQESLSQVNGILVGFIRCVRGRTCLLWKTWLEGHRHIYGSCFCILLYIKLHGLTVTLPSKDTHVWHYILVVSQLFSPFRFSLCQQTSKELFRNKPFSILADCWICFRIKLEEYMRVE